MLASANRMKNSAEFSDVIRRGERGGNRLLVTYVVPSTYTNEADRKVGFIVGKTVGNSVVRHRVYRRLRHIIRDLLPILPIHGMVIRALPEAAEASSAQLEAALMKALAKTSLKVDS